MSQPAVAADIHQPLDVHRDLTPKVTLDAHFLVDDLADSINFIVSQVAHARIRIDTSAVEKPLAGVQPNSIDIGKRRFNPLIARKIDSRNSRHAESPLRPPASERSSPVAACAEGSRRSLESHRDGE